MAMKALPVLVALLILAACTSFTPREGQPVTDYRKGKDGVIISFSENTPPKKVYEQTEFIVVVKLWNKGAYDNPSGRIYLSGFDPASMAFSPQEQEIPPVLGSSQYLPGGGFETVTFTANDVNVLSGDIYKPVLMASACYRYMTLATPTVCIVPRPADLLKNRICEPKTITMQNQGAPVAVTRVDEEVMDGAVNFIITIQNVGGGMVVSPDSMDRCPFQLDYKYIDQVDAKVLIRSLEAAECTPTGGKVKLVDGKGIISCRFTIPVYSGYDSTQTSYTTPLEIQLGYGYNVNVQKSVEIARIPGTKPYQGP